MHTVAGVDGGGVLLDGVDGAAVDGVVGGSVVVVVAVVDDVEVDDDELLVLGIVVVVDVDSVSAGVRMRSGSDEPCSMLAAAAVTDTARDVVVIRGHCSLSAPSGPCALLRSGKGRPMHRRRPARRRARLLPEQFCESLGLCSGRAAAATSSHCQLAHRRWNELQLMS